MLTSMDELGRLESDLATCGVLAYNAIHPYHSVCLSVLYALVTSGKGRDHCHRKLSQNPGYCHKT